jgi:hypothetical protein
MKIFQINILVVIFSLSVECISITFNLLVFLVLKNISFNLKLIILRLYRKKNINDTSRV